MNILHKGLLLSKMKNINECRFSRVISSLSKVLESANYHLLFVFLLVRLFCSFKCSSWSAVGVVLGMQDWIKLLLKLFHCNWGNWLMECKGFWLYLFLVVNTNVLSLLENCLILGKTANSEFLCLKELFYHYGLISKSAISQAEVLLRKEWQKWCMFYVQQKC